MKFFTRAWISGEMTVEQTTGVPEAYWSYLTTLHLPPTIAALSQVNPHDAYLLGVEHQPEYSRLTLRLRCGDLQRGYSDVLLAFSHVNIDPVSLETLRRAVRPADVEVLYDEVDCSSECYEYRLLFFPDGEVSIRFRQVEITKQRAVDRKVE